MAEIVRNIEQLLSAPPTSIYEFELLQSPESRLTAVRQLPEDAAMATVHIFETYLMPGIVRAAKRPLAESERTPEFFMSVEPEFKTLLEYDLRYHSDDWRLRVFTNAEGSFYDFNGWPWDVESGAGIYYRSGDTTPTGVFVNTAETLTALDPAYESVVRHYSVSRSAVWNEKSPENVSIVCADLPEDTCPEEVYA